MCRSDIMVLQSSKMTLTPYVAALCACLSIVAAQPTACLEDTQCASGYYCEERAHFCRECVRCDDYKRLEPPPGASCVKSVVQCGPCFEGLEELRGDGGCMAGSSSAQAGPILPTYAWVLICFAIFVVLLLAFIVVISKRDSIFKVSPISNISTTFMARQEVPPSAPAMPPPTKPPPPAYDDVYLAERPVSPDGVYVPQEDRPLIKRASESGPAPGEREAARSVAAQPFSPPAYVRVPGTSTIHSDESEPGSPFPPHDEDTVESLWTPYEQNNNDNTASNNTNDHTVEEGTEASGEVATGRTRRASGDDGPPSKAVCIREEASGSTEQEAAASAGGAAGGARVTFVINNFTNISVPRP